MKCTQLRNLLLSLTSIWGLTPLVACHSDKDDDKADVEATDDSEAAQPPEPLAPPENKPPQNVAPAETNAVEEPPAVVEEAPAVVEEKTTAPLTPSAQTSAGLGVGVIRFVKTESLEIYDQPSKSGKSVGTLHRGDHVFVEISEGWAKVSGRGYVEATALSDTPIARPRHKPSWRKH